MEFSYVLGCQRHVKHFIFWTLVFLINPWEFTCIYLVWYLASGLSPLDGSRINFHFALPIWNSTRGCLWEWTLEEKKEITNKKHSKNADISTSVTFDLVVWPWLFVKVKKADVIRCHLLYCTLVPGMMSMGLILYEISQFVYLMWHLTFTCDLQLLSRSLAI